MIYRNGVHMNFKGDVETAGFGEFSIIVINEWDVEGTGIAFIIKPDTSVDEPGYSGNGIRDLNGRDVCNLRVKRHIDNFEVMPCPFKFFSFTIGKDVIVIIRRRAGQAEDINGSLTVYEGNKE